MLSPSVLLCTAAAFLVTAAPTVSAAGLVRGRQLLIANATASAGTVTTFGRVTKYARNPLLKIGAQRAADKDPERPWSSGGLYSAIVADQSGKRSGKPWRAYFTADLNWTMDPRCTPGSTCETGASGLLYAESPDGVSWTQPNVGIMWPPNATDPKEQTRSVSLPKAILFQRQRVTL